LWHGFEDILLSPNPSPTRGEDNPPTPSHKKGGELSEIKVETIFKFFNNYFIELVGERMSHVTSKEK